MRDFHLKVDLQPAEFIAEAIVKEFQKEGSVENERILIVRAEITRDVLAPKLTEMGAIVDEAIAYRTVPETDDISGATERFRNDGADLVTFTSSSTVENFMALKFPIPAGMKTASIGPITSRTMRALGLPVDVEARQHDVPGLVQAIKTYYASKTAEGK